MVNEPQSTQDPPLLDAQLRRAVTFTVVAGVSLALPAGGVFGGKAAFSVIVGCVASVINLLLFAQIGRLLAGGAGGGWGLLFALKTLGFFGGIWWVFRAEVVDVLPFVVGYGSLPLGITLAQLLAPARLPPMPAPPGQRPPRSTDDADGSDGDGGDEQQGNDRPRKKIAGDDDVGGGVG